MLSAYPPLEEIFPTLKTKTTTQTPLPKSLKEDVKRDLRKRTAWFNDLELADYHVINGARILCVFDRYDAALAVVDAGRTTSKGIVVMAGLQSDSYLLFIRADEYNGTPRVGQEITIDGIKLYIRGSVFYDGVYEITLNGGFER